MSYDVDPKVLTELFLTKMDTDMEKTAAEAGAFVRMRLRELSFMRKIMQPEYVTAADCQRSVNHDQLVKIVDKEPNSTAQALNFRGKPNANYVTGERYEISFYMISSDDFQKTEEELLAYEMPITDVIERNSVKDIQKIEDTKFMETISGICSGTGGKEDTIAVASGTALNPIPPSVFRQGFNLLEETSGSSPHYTDLILMNQSDYNKLIEWNSSQVGDSIANEITINGFTYPTLFGKKVISTIKGELVPENDLYFFAPKEYLGHAYILGDTKFWIKKEKNLVTWAAYEFIGVGIGNINGVARITYSVT